MMNADGMFQGTAAQVLEYARANGIKGALVRRFRGGREDRAYKLDRGPAHIVLARPEEHVA